MTKDALKTVPTQESGPMPPGRTIPFASKCKALPPVEIKAEQMIPVLRAQIEVLQDLLQELEKKGPRDAVETAWPPGPIIYRCNGGGA